MATCGKRGIPPILCTLFALFVSLLFAYSTQAQTTAPQRSQAEINEEAQAAYKAGTAPAAKNDFKTAETEFEKVVRLVPKIEEGHSALGTVLLRQGKFPEAIKELEQALALKPGDIAAQTNLAVAYEQTGAHK